MTSSLSAILMFHVFQIESSVSMKMSEFESLTNLWWSFPLSNRVNDSRELRERWSTSEIDEISFWLTWCSTDWVSWRDIGRSAWRCFALKFNRSPCSWWIFFSSSSFLSKRLLVVSLSFCDLLVWEVSVHWVVESSRADFEARSAYWWLRWVDCWLNETVVLRCLCFMRWQLSQLRLKHWWIEVKLFYWQCFWADNLFETQLTRRCVSWWEKIEVVEIRIDERLMFWIDVFWWEEIQRIFCEFQIIIKCFIQRISCK